MIKQFKQLFEELSAVFTTEKRKKLIVNQDEKPWPM